MARPTAASAAATTSTKKTSTWPSVAPERPGEGHEGEVDRVQHQLHAHEDGDDVPAQEHPEGADGEEQQAQEQRGLDEARRAHGGSFRARTMAPTRAARISTDVASNT